MSTTRLALMIFGCAIATGVNHPVALASHLLSQALGDPPRRPASHVDTGRCPNRFAPPLPAEARLSYFLSSRPPTSSFPTVAPRPQTSAEKWTRPNGRHDGPPPPGWACVPKIESVARSVDRAESSDPPPRFLRIEGSRPISRPLPTVPPSVPRRKGQGRTSVTRTCRVRSLSRVARRPGARPRQARPRSNKTSIVPAIKVRLQNPADAPQRRASFSDAGAPSARAGATGLNMGAPDPPPVAECLHQDSYRALNDKASSLTGPSSREKHPRPCPTPKDEDAQLGEEPGRRRFRARATSRKNNMARLAPRQGSPSIPARHLSDPYRPAGRRRKRVSGVSVKRQGRPTLTPQGRRSFFLANPRTKRAGALGRFFPLGSTAPDTPTQPRAPEKKQDEYPSSLP